jgi:hypothetical protein
MKLMTEADIPAFVEAVAATGCDITAIRDHSYTIGDVDLPEPKCDEVQADLDAITRRFGDRDHLKEEIIVYLHSVGRSYREEMRH